MNEKERWQRMDALEDALESCTCDFNELCDECVKNAQELDTLEKEDAI